MSNKIKKIMIVLLIIVLVDTSMPFLNSQADFFSAAFKKWIAEPIFEAISKWLIDIGDRIIEKLEKTFISFSINFKVGQTYCVRYSPGIIFSGQKDKQHE